MKPNTKHEEYEKHYPEWEVMEDVLEGEDAVHSEGEKYLPRLTGQTNQEYDAYVMRAPFYNATSRTVDGLIGMIFRKAPTIVTPTGMQDIVDDMTLDNTGLDELAEQLTRELVGIGRVGVLVEYPRVVNNPTTLADVAAQNLRPYVTTYEAEQIINWRMERINNVMQPVMIALEEEICEYKNEFESEEIEQIRVLILREGTYQQEVYRKVKSDQDEWFLYEVIVPMMRGQTLGAIPFVCMNARGVYMSPDKPPMYDLATLNLSHYRTTADLEHGAHFTGLPTAVVSGYTKESENDVFRIGSSTAWIFPDPSANAKYLEFTGQGLDTLRNIKKDKEDNLAILGARMLAPEKKQSEAADTVRMRHAGDGAILSAITNAVSQGLNKCLEIMAQWEGTEPATIQLNEDYLDQPLSAQDLQALVQAWQQGAISDETLFYNLKVGEVMDEMTTFEEEQARIANQPPRLAV
jgi:hypothetical protein